MHFIDNIYYYLWFKLLTMALPNGKQVTTMTAPNVVVPIFETPTFNDKYDQLFAFLNERKATVHLIVANAPKAVVHTESPALQAQQTQVLKMSHYLKYEMLDRLARGVQARFTNLTFEYHVKTEPLQDAVGQLMQKTGFDLLAVESKQLLRTDSAGAALNRAITSADVPVWAVSEHTGSDGMVLSTLDIPAHNASADRLNRILVITASNIAEEQGAELLLLHGWMKEHEQFLKQWLRLNEMDIARVSKSDRKQRLSYLHEYALESGLTGSAVSCKVCTADSSGSLVEFCNQLKPQLVVAGITGQSYGATGSTTRQLLQEAHADVLLLPGSKQISSLFTALPKPEISRRNKKA